MKTQSVFILFILILLKIIISVPVMNAHPIDLDEPFSIFHSQKSLVNLFELFKNENNPPIHFILLHFWEKLFGIGPFAVRSLSLLFSVLTIPVLFSIGRKFINERGEIILVLLFIFSDFHHYHSLEARSYSLLVFEFSLLFYLLLTIFTKGKEATWKQFIGLGIVNILLFYTHYISPTIFLAEITLILIYFKQFSFKKIIGSIAVFILGILPWIPVFYQRISTTQKTGTWVEKASYSELYGLFNKFLNDKWVMLFLALILLLLLLKFGRFFIEIVTNQKRTTLVSLCLLFVPFLSAFIFSRMGIATIFYDRYLFFITLPLFFLLARVFSTQKVAFSVGFIVFFSVYLLRFDYFPDTNRDADKIAQYVHQQHVHSIIIVPNYYDVTFLYHYNQALFKDVEIRSKENTLEIYPIEYSEELKSIRLSGKIAIIDADFKFTSNEKNPNDWILEKHYHLLKRKVFKGNYTVSIYAPDLIGQ